MIAPDVYIRGRDEKAIRWFKTQTHEPMQHVSVLKAMIEEFGYYIDLFTNSVPGIVI